MKIIREASGKTQIKMSKSEWINIGVKSGWMGKTANPDYYDDNFGKWNMGDDPEEMKDFYDEVQRDSIEKECKGCGRTVKIRRQYAYCNSCADKIERGIPVGEW